VSNWLFSHSKIRNLGIVITAQPRRSSVLLLTPSLLLALIRSGRRDLTLTSPNVAFDPFRT
jgi:hypothetical protein